jgi:hypothetical protein
MSGPLVTSAVAKKCVSVVAIALQFDIVALPSST